jgi:hypothetical protein
MERLFTLLSHIAPCFVKGSHSPDPCCLRVVPSVKSVESGFLAIRNVLHELVQGEQGGDGDGNVDARELTCQLIV